MYALLCRSEVVRRLKNAMTGCGCSGDRQRSEAHSLQTTRIRWPCLVVGLSLRQAVSDLVSRCGVGAAQCVLFQ